MREIRIAIVGLGKSGERFLDRLVACGDVGPHIICAVAVESNSDAGRRKADALGIAVVGIDALAGFGNDIDVILMLTEDEALHARLRQMLASCGNRHTQVLSEKAMQLAGMLVEMDEACAA